MSAQEKINKILDAKEVTHKGVKYLGVRSLIFRKINDEVVAYVELLDINLNSVTCARLSHVSIDEVDNKKEGFDNKKGINERLERLLRDIEVAYKNGSNNILVEAENLVNNIMRHCLRFKRIAKQERKGEGEEDGR